MKEYDVIVLGGGMAGTAAAIAAARQGTSVLLVDQSGYLGGAATNCLVTPFMRSHTNVDGKYFPLCRGIFAETVKDLKDFESCANQSYGMGYFNSEYLKILLMRKLKAAGAEVLLRVTLCDVVRKGNRIESITVVGKASKIELKAKRFIDATGDADLTAMAEFPFSLGRSEDNLCQPMTLCFRISGVDREKFDACRKDIQQRYRQAKLEGKITNPREDVLMFNTLDPSVIHFNSTRVVKLNPTDPTDLTKAEIIAHEQMIELYSFLKNNFECFKNSYISQSASQIGVRESRMICGEYTLTQEDILELKKPDDTIALGNYDIDIHSPTGSGTSHHFFKDGEFYGIPYRSLIPKSAENMLVAGRCISCDHGAQASLRIMPIVCCIGEAAGVAAAQSVKTDTNVSDIDIALLHRTLVDIGALPEKY